MLMIKVLQCSSCGKIHSIPGYHCKSCKSEKLDETEVPGKGTLYTYSTVHVPLATHEKEAPYTVAIIELEGGCKITGRILGTVDKLSVGLLVEVNEIKDEVYIFRLSD
ncbi:MAG: OB-fold domain-containing protein [Candidatus Dadabacteria bacterium]|nr:OB-fold domain-containing protein [Candidatus Dadabacteria bacterium]